MKLTTIQVERTLRQFDARAIPENHPVMSQLSELFGDHTFFLDDTGLSIVEPAAEEAAGAQVVRVVKLANWSDEGLTSLSPHEPELTEDVIELGSRH